MSDFKDYKTVVQLNEWALRLRYAANTLEDVSDQIRHGLSTKDANYKAILGTLGDVNCIFEESKKLC